MDKRHYPLAVVFAGLLALSTIYLNSLIAVPVARPTAQIVADLSTERYLKHVSYLASPDMKGRASGSPELEKAAEYIAQQFRVWGLRPAGANNTYFQNFELTTGAKPGTKNELRLNGVNLKINEDFVPIIFSNTAEFEGAVVFAGYGITAP